MFSITGTSLHPYKLTTFPLLELWYDRLLHPLAIKSVMLGLLISTIFNLLIVNCLTFISFLFKMYEIEVGPESLIKIAKRCPPKFMLKGLLGKFTLETQ